jgi:hypothetical protein
MRALVGCALIALSACTTSEPVTAVTVRDANFAVVKELSVPEVESFTQLWGNKVKVAETFTLSEKHHYKLDIGGGADPGRWLYNPNGQTSELDPMVQPVFRLQNIEAFNKLIGATP